MTAGRPRDFDTDRALELALLVFWQKGYEGASLADLTAAMGINRPSLYAAFGNKEALFRKTLDRYAATRADFQRRALDAPRARDAIEQVLRGTVDFLADKRHPKGCMITQGALACGQEADSIRRELIARRCAAEADFRRRLERAEAEGDLPPWLQPAAFAKYLATLLQGMAVQAAGGASRDELQQVADLALAVWDRPRAA
jgi:AcrR family transcriptional regulator